MHEHINFIICCDDFSLISYTLKNTLQNQINIVMVATIFKILASRLYESRGISTIEVHKAAASVVQPG